MRKILFLLMVLTACLAFAGCGSGSPAAGENGKTLTYKDQTVNLKSLPQRPITLTAPLLNMAYAVGGTSLARPTTQSPIPDAAKSLPELGQVSHIDMEKLVSLNPDFIIGETKQNQKLESLLKSNNLPYILVNYDGISDNVPLLKFLGEVYGKEDQAAQVIAKYEAGVKAAEDKAAGYTPAKVAVLRATGKDVTAETPESICASMVSYLKMNNVITAHKELNLSDKTVPYSLEQLTADDPDVIFIVTMGKAAEINKKLDEEMRSNPAWSGLKAVKAGKVFFLPYDLFLMNPGVRTPEAMEQLIHLAYEGK